MGSELRQFLEYLAIKRRIAAATQNQSLNAVAFLCRHVLEQAPGETGTFNRAKCSLRLSLKERLTTKLRSKSHFLKQSTTEFEVLGGCPVMGKSD